MNFDELKQQCLACQRCGLCETRTHVVFGQGVPDAEVLFVGEGPGANEDAQGLPFVGRSGQLLDHYLEAIDLDRSKNIYITNKEHFKANSKFLYRGNYNIYYKFDRRKFWILYRNKSRNGNLCRNIGYTTGQYYW